jgi:hypothetical protein
MARLDPLNLIPRSALDGGAGDDHCCPFVAAGFGSSAFANVHVTKGILPDKSLTNSTRLNTKGSNRGIYMIKFPTKSVVCWAISPVRKGNLAHWPKISCPGRNLVHWPRPTKHFFSSAFCLVSVVCLRYLALYKNVIPFVMFFCCCRCWTTTYLEVSGRITAQHSEYASVLPCFDTPICRSSSEGKLNRGLSVIDSYMLLREGTEVDDEDFYLACVLGWCVEWVSTRSNSWLLCHRMLAHR